jgi:hypothetical protein
MKTCPRCEKGELKPLSEGTCWYCSSFARPVFVCRECGFTTDEACLKRVEAEKKAQASRDLGKEFKREEEEGSAI